MINIAVLADTHIPKRAKTLPAGAWEVVRSADAIIHAGDVLTKNFLDELTKYAPVHAVRGNNDLELPELPESLLVPFGEIIIAVIHDSGQRKGREKRMRQRFPDADVVVFGHSHIPWNECVDNQLLFNPGSATDRRMQPSFTMGLLRLNGTTVTGSIIEV